MIESELNQRFRFLIKGTPEQAAALKVGAILPMLGRPSHQ
jgi:hypothetical protein